MESLGIVDARSFRLTQLWRLSRVVAADLFTATVSTRTALAKGKQVLLQMLVEPAFDVFVSALDVVISIDIGHQIKLSDRGPLRSRSNAVRGSVDWGGRIARELEVVRAADAQCIVFAVKGLDIAHGLTSFRCSNPGSLCKRGSVEPGLCPARGNG